VDAPNLKLAVGTAMLQNKPLDMNLVTRLKGRVGIWLVAAQQTDIAGRAWDNHAPLHSMRDLKAMAQWVATAPAAPIILDAVYGNQDDEYLDAMTLDRMLKKR
jgi:hypothetical protein